MTIDTGNEITVKLKCTTKELIEKLLSDGYQKTMHFTLNDDYFIPQDLDTTSMSVRDIISRAVLVRDVFNDTASRHDKKLTYKIKEIDSQGKILSQKAYNCDVASVSSAKSFLEAIGYRFLMNIKEDDWELTGKDGFQIATKDIKNGDDLIEIETNEQFNTIDKLINRLKASNIPYYDDNYFVKKAEIELEKVLAQE